MNLFDQHDTDRNCYEQICDFENNRNFLLIVSITALLNKKFYSPVAFLVEYIENKKLQLMIENVTGYTYYGFLIMFLRNFPNVSKSRKLKKIVDTQNDKPED